LEDRKDILGNYNSHCFYFLDIPNSALQELHVDDVFLDLSKEFFNCTMHLGVELELSVATIEEICLKNPMSYFDQNYDVMKEWRQTSKVKPTILVLMKAFQHVDQGGVKFLTRKYG
jgi:hypothetical protein